MRALLATIALAIVAGCAATSPEQRIAEALASGKPPAVGVDADCSALPPDPECVDSSKLAGGVHP